MQTTKSTDWSSTDRVFNSNTKSEALGALACAPGSLPPAVTVQDQCPAAGAAPPQWQCQWAALDSPLDSQDRGLVDPGEPLATRPATLALRCVAGPFLPAPPASVHGPVPVSESHHRPCRFDPPGTNCTHVTRLRRPPSPSPRIVSPLTPSGLSTFIPWCNRAHPQWTSPFIAVHIQSHSTETQRVEHDLP